MVWWPLLVPLIAVSDVAVQAGGVVTSAAVAAGVTYLIGRRNTSGTVTTSTATDLWTASDSLRRDLTAVLDHTNAALSDERQARQDDRVRFEREIARLEAAVDHERAERHRVEGVNRDLVARVAVLESQTDG